MIAAGQGDVHSPVTKVEDQPVVFGEVGGKAFPRRDRQRLGTVEIGLVAGEVVAGSLSSSKPALTDREVEVAGLVGRGLENSEIAERLGIAEGTVRTHLLNILRNLELRNRVELARHALAQGWVSLDRDPRVA